MSGFHSRRRISLRATAAPELSFRTLPLLGSKAEHLVLAGPFGWQVGEAGNSHPMREPAVDGGLDEIGREENQPTRLLVRCWNLFRRLVAIHGSAG